MSKSSFRRLDFFANEIIFLNVVTNKSTLQEMSLLCLPWLVQADIKKGYCHEVNPGTGRTLFGGKYLNLAFLKLNIYNTPI